MKRAGRGAELGMIGGSIAATCFFAWLTHIVVVVQAKAWAFGILGALLPPLGVAHGIAFWFGADWLN